jgi:hypothetical protein
VRLAIDPLRDTQIDTLYWQLGTDPALGASTFRQGGAPRYTDIYSHSTNVGPRWGEGRDKFDSAGDWRIYENTRQLIAEGTDAPAVVIEEGHRAGLEVFISMRVNDTHDGMSDDPQHPLLSPIKREHPDWLLGPPKGYDVNSPLPRKVSRFAYNFAVPEVRAYKLALAEETIANYDLDGLDLDYCRTPRLFPDGEGPRAAGLLTDLMRKIRASLDRKGAGVGRKIHLSVRVPPTFELALAFGMDVKTWIDEKLIDILIAGVTTESMHRMPVEEYVDAAQGTHIQVIAQGLGLQWQGRPMSARVLWHEPECYPVEMCRASAACCWRAGVDGLYLFNNHIIEFLVDADYDRQPWKEIADPDLIARKDKHYLVDYPRRTPDRAVELGAPTVPPSPLPVSLSEPGDTCEIPIDVADDLASAARDGALKEATLRLMIRDLTSLDRLAFELNGTLLDADSARERLLYNECWLDFDVSKPLLAQGWNHLKLKVMDRNPHIAAPLGVESVEVIVRYK